MHTSTESWIRSWRSWLDVVASIAMLIAACFIVYTLFRGRPPESRQANIALPAEPVSLTGASTLGKVDAPIGMLIFSDFQCPYCKRFALDTLPTLRQSYVDSGKVLLAFNNLPLTSIHSRAMSAAAAVECAGRQHAFWPMHDQLFSGRADLEDTGLKSYADSVGLDVRAFEACLGEKPSATIDQSIALARKLGIGGTPTVLLGRMQRDGLKVMNVFQGALPFADFKKAIDSLLQQS